MAWFDLLSTTNYADKRINAKCRLKSWHGFTVKIPTASSTTDTRNKRIFIFGGLAMTIYFLSITTLGINELTPGVDSNPGMV